MIGLLVVTCLAANPACEPADPRTCVKTRVCTEEFVPIGADKVPSQQECQLFGMMFLGKPDGWLAEHAHLRLKAWRCGESVEFNKKKEQEA